MANSKLQGNTYLVPDNVLQHIEAAKVNYPNSEGIKRAKNITHEPNLSYEAIKRIKNFFDTYNPQITDAAQYELAGGKEMRAFIEATLNQERAGTKRSKDVRRDIQSGNTQDLKAFQSPELNEAEKKEKKEKDKNAVAIIVNNDNKILLLKRGAGAPWMPNKWSLVGGGIEKGETPQKAIEREILEETGLEIKKFVKTLTIERHADSIEHLFACRYTGEPTDIDLDDENSNYGWYDQSEMEYLDTVPHLIEYITLVFKKYD